MKENIILSMKNIRKTYPGVIALDNVSLDFKRGEVHALVGENGAGKSTLVKILSGAVEPDQGTFSIDGEVLEKITPKESKKRGIEIIYQELNLFSSLSVAENVFIGNSESNGVIVNFKEMRQKTVELFKQMEVDIDPKSFVSDLPIAQRQLVEIAKTLAIDSKILIFDEPTASLSVHETEVLFKLIQNLRDRAVTIIYISHRMSEVFEISDRLTVMRDGKIIATKNTKDTNRAELIKLMVGRELNETFLKHRQMRGRTILEIKNLGGGKIHDISFSVKQGEVLGLAGLMGAGRSEIARMIFGADKIEKGDIFLDGKKVEITSTKDAVGFGIGFLPEDRKEESIFVELSVKENITLPILRKISKHFIVNKEKEKGILNKYKNRLQIKTPSFKQIVKNLSGGNQQKVAISKWLASESKVLIFDEPTRGIDVGAKHEIYQLINQLAEENIAIILITSDMEEMLGMADRILVIHEGTLAGSIEDHEKFKQEYVLDLASGR